MILTESEQMLVIILGAFMFMAIIGSTIKDYQRMSKEAKNKIKQFENDAAYVKELKEVIDEKNETLQKQIREKNKA